AERGLAHVGGGITMRKPLANDAADPTATTFALASQALG
ncbi:GNAT family N-acetyltransferase, partial [Rhizobium leguminosarum]